MHDWQYYTEILENVTQPALSAELKLNDLKKAQGVDTTVNAGQLIRDEWHFKKNTDLAIRHWIQHRQWPLNPEIMPHVRIRFHSAIGLIADGKLMRLKLDATEKKKRVLTWLLIHHWHTFGRGAWIFGLLHPDLAYR